jgi:hypothetical protein
VFLLFPLYKKSAALAMGQCHSQGTRPTSADGLTAHSSHRLPATFPRVKPRQSLMYPRGMCPAAQTRKLSDKGRNFTRNLACFPKDPRGYIKDWRGLTRV